MISIDDFKKVEVRAGKVLAAEKVEGSEKLLKLSVDFGNQADSAMASAGEGREIRQIISGIAKYISPEELVGATCAFVTNLEPRAIMGLESQAMIMAASTEEGEFSLLKIAENIPPGTLIK